MAEVTLSLVNDLHSDALPRSMSAGGEGPGGQGGWDCPDRHRDIRPSQPYTSPSFMAAIPNTTRA